MLRTVMSKIVNPPVEALLSTPAHRLVSPSLCILRYEGRRSGKRYSLVVQYAQPDDATVVVWPGQPDTKTWWRNFLDPMPAALQLRGQTRSASGRIITEGEQWRRAFAAYRDRYPRWVKDVDEGHPLLILELA